jgi:DNA mismatch repair protein MutL
MANRPVKGDPHTSTTIPPRPPEPGRRPPSGPASGRVRRLPDTLVDQIAAGEVVERPASVVKELVENALDAGAGRVRVEVREGGSALVAVTDDGSGMNAADARLALERHATSKIASADDLTRIGSFGFRGEALPAIASVSRLRLRTRATGAPEGFEIEVEAGRRRLERAAGCPEGTRIEVADLFHNVPARRKFLKTAATEWGHVADWLGRAALALPAVHFDVRREDRPAVSWPAVGDPLERIAAVLSEREAEGLVALAGGEGALQVEGFVSRPDAHRPNPSSLYLFVRGRPVRDRLLRHALLEAYRDVLPRGRFPAAVLFLTLPPDAVDVNVHPAKWEVRFADPGAVHRLVTRAVRDALAGRRWLAGPPRPPGSAAGAQAPPYVARAGAGDRVAETRGSDDWLFVGQGTSSGALASSAGTTPAGERSLRFAGLRLLGQLLATYLLVEAADGLLLVDQHAAHERVLYERLRAAWQGGSVPRQPLLLAETAELPPDRVARLGEASGELERIGFEIEPFGADAVAIRAIPALLAGRDPAGLVRDLADELVEAGGGGGLRTPDTVERLFASLACHAARRAGERLDPAEQEALLGSLDTIPWAPTCPHGRPVAVPIGRGEIERRFGRT